jgi:alpha-ketoglutarate-dependent taurine dioxygenase
MDNRIEKPKIILPKLETNSMENNPILDSRRSLETLLLRIPSSNNIEEFKVEIVEKFNKFGALIVEFQNDEEARDQLLCFGSVFGTTMTHDRADEDMIAEIAVSKNFQGYLGTSSAAHPFHTDGTYDDTPPKAVALRCEIPAEHGGITQLASGEAIYNYLLSQNKEIAGALFAPDALCVERAGKKSCQPVFLQEGDRIFIRYRFDETSKLSTNPKVQEAMLLIKKFLEDEKNYMAFTLKEKQVLLTDNTRVLHARTAFPEKESRKMHRLFFSGNSSSDASVTFGFSK